MPVQVQSLITPEYTTIVSVPGDGEVATEASYIDMAVALGNRIEYVKNRIPSASDDPDLFNIVNEDFLGAIHDTTNFALYANHTWRVTTTGTASIAAVDGTPKNPGQVQCTLAVSSSLRCHLISASGDSFTFADLEHATFVVKMNMTGTGGVFSIGFKEQGANIDGGTDSLQLTYLPLISSEWMWQIRQASAETMVAVGAQVTDEHIVFKLVKVATGIECYVNGAFEGLLLTADLPAGNCALGFGMVTDGATTMIASVDMIYARATITDRAGA